MVRPPRGDVGGMAGVAELMTEVLQARGLAVANVYTSVGPREENLIAKALRHVAHFVRCAVLLARTRPAILWIHTCSGFSFYLASLHAATARLLRHRVILHLHGGRFADFSASAGPLSGRWIRRTLERAHAVVVLSTGWQRQIRQIAPKAEIQVMENAVALSPPRICTSRSKDLCHFGYLGRLDVEKGVHEMLDAARVLAASGVGFRLTMAGLGGSAGDPAEVAGAAAKLGIAQYVEVIGPVAEAAKEAFFADCHVYVHPSHFEGMPLAVLEAMSRGLPVIATRVGAIPEAISDGQEGLLVPVKDANMLAAAMRALASDGLSRRQMGAKARELAARRFSVERFGETLFQILRRVTACVSEQPAPPAAVH